MTAMQTTAPTGSAPTRPGAPTLSAPASATVPTHELDSFRIANPREVLLVLDGLRQGRVPVVISNPHGAVISTMLWGVDEPAQRLNFSARDDSHQLDTLVEGNEALAVAYLDAVQVQFELSDLLLVRAATASALQSRMPGCVYRFQRRDTYRVLPPRHDTPQVLLRHPNLPDMQLSLRVVDISLGGCALWLPADVPALPPGATLTEVRVELDAQTHFTAQLTLRHVVSMGSAEVSEHGVRVGCAWRPSNATAARSLQRWIDQSQKRMRLLSQR